MTAPATKKKTQLPVVLPRRDSGNAEYEALRTKVLERYDKALGLLQRSHAVLYALLGFIYRMAFKIDAKPALRALLVTDVHRIQKEELEMRRCDAEKRSTFDLLLLLRTELSPDLASSKSGWLAALNAAKENNVKPTETAYVKWITPLGVSGARKLGKELPEFDLAGFAEGIQDQSASFTIDLPANAEPPEDMILMLGRVVARTKNKADVALIDVITDEKPVRSQSAKTFKRWEQERAKRGERFARAAQNAAQQEFGDPAAPDLKADISLLGGEHLLEIERKA